MKIKKFEKFVIENLNISDIDSLLDKISAGEDLTAKERDDLSNFQKTETQPESVTDYEAKFFAKLPVEKWGELGGIADRAIWFGGAEDPNLEDISGYDKFKDSKTEIFRQGVLKTGYLTDQDAVELGGWEDVMDFAVEFA
jgi:hypothetical protein